jgi:hypothetical protein
MQNGALTLGRCATQGDLQPGKGHERFELRLAQIAIGILESLRLWIGQHRPVGRRQQLRLNAVRQKKQSEEEHGKA